MPVRDWRVPRRDVNRARRRSDCFIGARGTGKTTALEFLRYGLDRMPDPKIDKDRRHEIEKLIEENLARGTLAISIRTQAGLRYVVRRSCGGDPAVTNEIGESVSIPLDDGRLFAVDVYSQNQIEDMARNPAAQLALIDRFSNERLLEVETELQNLRTKLKDLAGQLRKLDDEISTQAGLASEASVFRERLKGLAPPAERIADEVHASALVRLGRCAQRRSPHRHVFELSSTHLEPFLVIDPLRCLAIDRPPLASQKAMQSVIAPTRAEGGEHVEAFAELASQGAMWAIALTQARKAQVAARATLGEVGDLDRQRDRRPPVLGGHHFFSQEFFHHLQIQRLIGDQALELAILFFERLQALGLIHLQATVLLLPAIQRLFGHGTPVLESCQLGAGAHS